MEWNPQKVLENVRRAETDDLLDRVTAYRRGMEPEAIEMIEDELRRRGVDAVEIEERRQIYERECMFYPDGTAMMCSFCRLPAVAQSWGWHKLRNMVPLFPRRFRYCKAHRPANLAEGNPPRPV